MVPKEQLTKQIHVGTILCAKRLEYMSIRASKHDVLKELNDWMFDYLHVNKYPIKQLPPLDDWIRSDEDMSLWSIEFPHAPWLITIRHENIVF